MKTGKLTPLESKLQGYLAEHCTYTSCSLETLREDIWDGECVRENVIVAISNLRKKIGSDAVITLRSMVPGQGPRYLFRGENK
jgi:DNA-binding response OmpR family regulator